MNILSQVKFDGMEETIKGIYDLVDNRLKSEKKIEDIVNKADKQSSKVLVPELVDKDQSLGQTMGKLQVVI